MRIWAVGVLAYSDHAMGCQTSKQSDIAEPSKTCATLGSELEILKDAKLPYCKPDEPAPTTPTSVTADVVPQVPIIATPLPSAPSTEVPPTPIGQLPAPIATAEDENPLQQMMRFINDVLEKFKQQEEAAAAPEALPSAEARALAKATNIVQTV